MDNQVDEIDQVSNRSGSISQITSQSFNDSQNVTIAVEEQTASQEEITSEAVRLSMMADELNQLVSKFTM